MINFVLCLNSLNVLMFHPFVLRFCVVDLYAMALLWPISGNPNGPTMIWLMCWRGQWLPGGLFWWPCIHDWVPIAQPGETGATTRMKWFQTGHGYPTKWLRSHEFQRRKPPNFFGASWVVVALQMYWITAIYQQLQLGFSWLLGWIRC